MTTKNNTALQTVGGGESLSTQTARELQLEASYVQLIKDVYAKGASDEELALFLRTAKRLELDPVARQIFLVKRWDGDLQKQVATPQTSIDGFRLIADRTNKYVPGREATFEYVGDHLKSATAYVKKFVGGEWHEISSTAFFSEYVQTKKKDGQPNAMWSKMPHLMLAKCAESLALRKAFPAELSGIYTSEEMGQAHNEPEAVRGFQPSIVRSESPAQNVRFDAKDDEPETIDVSDAIDAQIVDDEPTLIVPTDNADDPDSKRDVMLAAIGEFCKRLNLAKDDIKWTNKRLDEFIDHTFETEGGRDSLRFESGAELIDMLKARLEVLTGGKA